MACPGLPISLQNQSSREAQMVFPAGHMGLDCGLPEAETLQSSQL